MDIKSLTALEIGKLIRNKKISCAEAADEFFRQIDAHDKQVNAFVSVLKDRTYTEAERVQKAIDTGEALSPLAGVPMAVKDNICIKNIDTTCGSKMLNGFKPPYDASIITKLDAAGAVILGKLNMDEFAMGGSTETSYYGVTKNPWDTSRVAGGSSGGSAAAVAAGEAAYAIGSDTGGSIRQPCAFCGTTGIKPTYGSVSRFGLVAYASSLDQIGVIGKDIQDCAEVLSIISGRDEKDSTSVIDKPFDFSGCYDGDIKGMKIGVPSGYFSDGLSDDIKNSVYEAIRLFERMGADVSEFHMTGLEYAVPAYYIIACAEASSNLSRYDGIKYGYRSAEPGDLTDIYVNSRSDGFGMEVKRRIMLGSFILSSGYYDAYYKKAQQARGIIKKAFDAAFERYDMIIGPTTPTTAFKIGENINDPLKMYLGDIYTVSVNLAGLPAAALPCGFDAAGLPIGMQLIGSAFREDQLVSAAYAYQQNTDYHKKMPVTVSGAGRKEACLG